MLSRTANGQYVFLERSGRVFGRFSSILCHFSVLCGSVAANRATRSAYSRIRLRMARALAVTPFFFIRSAMRGEWCPAAASTSASVIIPSENCFPLNSGLQMNRRPRRGSSRRYTATVPRRAPCVVDSRKFAPLRLARLISGTSTRAFLISRDASPA